MKTYGVILASGIGQRTGSYIPKQFVKIHGQPMIEYVIAAFQKAGLPLIITIPPGYKHDFTWPAIIVEGGTERTDTIRNALEILKSENADYVIFHDSARPLITPKIITDIQEQLYNGHDVLVTGTKITDSLLSLENTIRLEERNNYRLLQTPEAFKVSKLLKAYETLNTNPTLIAEPLLDDPTLSIYEPNLFNFKVTYPDDIRITEKLLIPDGIMPKPIQNNNILKGKRCLVLGASGGIGKAVVKELDKYCIVDTPGRDQIDLATDNWDISLNKYHYVIYAAGVCYKDNDIDKAKRTEIFQVNTHSVSRLLDLAPQFMIPGGSITVLGSSASTVGRPGFSDYSASKIAVNSIIQAKALELINQDIHVNCLCPAKTKTKMVETTRTSLDNTYFLEPTEVARAIINSLLTLQYGKIWYLYKGLDKEQ